MKPRWKLLTAILLLTFLIQQVSSAEFYENNSGYWINALTGESSETPFDVATSGYRIKDLVERESFTTFKLVEDNVTGETVVALVRIEPTSDPEKFWYSMTNPTTAETQVFYGDVFDGNHGTEWVPAAYLAGVLICAHNARQYIRRCRRQCAPTGVDRSNTGVCGMVRAKCVCKPDSWPPIVPK